MEEIRIKELGEIFTGKTPPTENPLNFGSAFPFVTPVDLIDSKYIQITERYISNIGIKHTTLIPENSICVTCIGYIGKIGITTKESCTNQQINSIVVNHEYDLDYVYYLLSYSVPYFKELAGINVVPQLNKRDFSKVKLQATKNKPEQTAIATLLSKVDEAIAATQNSIKAAEKLKKALMQNLLTGKLKPDGTWRTDDEFYEDEKFGKVPKGWHIIKGNKITDKITKGQSPKWQGFEYQDSGILFVTSENVLDGYIDLKEPKYLPIEFHNKIKNSQLQKGDVLINIVGASIGRCSVYNLDVEFANTNQAVCVFRPNAENDSNFIAYFIQNGATQNKLIGSQVETARANLSLGDFRKFKFVIPESKDEQISISLKLNEVNFATQSKQTKIQTLQHLKKSLMQNLLTGKVRLPAEFILMVNC
jgi:type I restriction enzyme, S subunit